MYYPYLRGKQYELIALRDVSSFIGDDSKKLSPVIEPVKKITSTLTKTITELAKHNINFTIILNPSVGGLKDAPSKILKMISEECKGLTNYQLGVIIEEATDYSTLFNIVKESNVKPDGFTFIHNSIRLDIKSIIKKYSEICPVTNNIINLQKTNGNRRYYREFNSTSIITLDDYFESENKNSAYLSKDTPFHEEHKYYAKDGYKGFADFLTIGDNYSDGGFMPYAVAIHISYIDNNNTIRVHHFVSDSNSDTSDVAGKFAEANTKLVNWCAKSGHDTIAIQNFIELHRTGHFPGLGSVKKLSIMNHIEVTVKAF